MSIRDLFADQPAQKSRPQKNGPVAVNYGAEAVLADLGLSGRIRAKLCREGCGRRASKDGQTCGVCADRKDMAHFVEQAQVAEANGDLNGARGAIEAIPLAARPFVSTDRERALGMLREVCQTMPGAWIMEQLEGLLRKQPKALRDAKLNRRAG